MKYYFITFRSITYAQRGERLLLAKGYRCTLQRTPRWMEEQGCGYSLRVAVGDVVPAVELLRSSELPMRKIYAQRSDGKWEELTL